LPLLKFQPSYQHLNISLEAENPREKHAIKIHSPSHTKRARLAHTVWW